MNRDRRLGLDELMIVNPSSSRLKAVYLGDDGRLYEVKGIEEDSIALGDELDEAFENDKVRAIGQYFLGTDGTLYGVEL